MQLIVSNEYWYSEGFSFGNSTIACCTKKLPSNGENIWPSVHHYKEEHSSKIQSWKDGVVLKQQKVKDWNKYPTIHCYLVCCANCFHPLAEWNGISRICFSHTLLGPGNELYDWEWVVTFSHPPTERISSCIVKSLVHPQTLPTVQFFNFAWCEFSGYGGEPRIATTIKTIVPPFKKAALPRILTTIIFRRRMATFSTMIGSKVNKSCWKKVTRKINLWTSINPKVLSRGTYTSWTSIFLCKSLFYKRMFFGDS